MIPLCLPTVRRSVLRSLAVFFFLIWLSPGFAQTAASKTEANRRIEPFPLAGVRLLNGPFKKAQDLDLKYLLLLEPDRLLAPYLREAGLAPKAESYGNWENTGLDGHIGGHYLSALSLMYAATGDARIRQRLKYMLSELRRCQDQRTDGYIAGIPGGAAMWTDVAAGRIDAGSFSLNKKWVPWYNIHKLFAGLRDAYQYGKLEEAKGMLVKLTDWAAKLVSGLDESQVQQMLRSEHGGMNEIFADVADLTGNSTYLALARRFSDARILQPLLQRQDRLNGLHANTQIPKVIGYKRIADETGDTAWAGAALFFWQNVVGRRTIAIGGNSVSEHFNPTGDFSSMIANPQGPETCNTYNMLKLSLLLFASSGQSSYLDYYERGLYNHILSSQHPEHGGFVYFTPIRPRHYRVYSQPATSFWCCVGSGMENHAKYGEAIYAHTPDALWVNLFIASKLEWTEKGLTLVQQTGFPEEEGTELQWMLKKSIPLTVHLRRPSWVKPGGFKVLVNGKETAVTEGGDGYVNLNRSWKNGDRIRLLLPMQTKVEALPDTSGYISLVHGPMVLATPTDTTDLEGLLADGSRNGHIPSGRLYPLTEAPVLVGDESAVIKAIKPVAGKPLHFTLSGLVYPAAFQQVEWMPFYRIHDARYSIYWQLTTAERLARRQARLAEEEKLRLDREARTIDVVRAGEQQPEVDHGFQGEQTNTGINEDRHWRDARGWFSYVLQKGTAESARLQVTYFGGDRGRTFDIFLNDRPLAAVTLDGSRGNQFYTVDYPIPPDWLKTAREGKLVVRFAARPGSVAGGVYEVRLMK